MMSCKDISSGRHFYRPRDFSGQRRSDGAVRSTECALDDANCDDLVALLFESVDRDGARE